MILFKKSKIKKIEQGEIRLENLNKQAQEDKDILLAAIKQNPENIKYAFPKYENDRDIILQTLRNCERTSVAFQNILKLLDKILPNFSNDEEIQVELAKNGVLKYNKLENKDIFMTALKVNPYAIKYIREDLQDLEMAFQTIKNGVGSYAELVGLISVKTRNNKEFMLEAMKKSCYSVTFSELKKDKEFILNALNNTEIPERCYLLGLVDPILQDDEDVVLTSVSSYLPQIRHASQRLQTDHEFLKKLALKLYEKNCPYSNIKDYNQILDIEFEKLANPQKFTIVEEIKTNNEEQTVITQTPIVPDEFLELPDDFEELLAKEEKERERIRFLEEWDRQTARNANREKNGKWERIYRDKDGNLIKKDDDEFYSFDKVEKIENIENKEGYLVWDPEGQKRKAIKNRRNDGEEYIEHGEYFGRHR